MKLIFRKPPIFFLVCLCLLSHALAASPFSDVDESAPYSQAVEYVTSKGIITGFPGNKFLPSNTITRAQMAAIVCRTIGQENPTASGERRFSDVSASHWANAYITTAASLGIINGFEDGTFRPNQTLNYNQGITMLIRAFGLREDAEQAGGYPNGYLSVARKYHLLDGVNVKDGGTPKRYEIAVMIHNFYVGGSESSSQPSQPAYNSLADGTYDMHIFRGKTGYDSDGNETAYVEILTPVVLSDEFVKSLSIGDSIPLTQYGFNYDLTVESWEILGDEIWINAQGDIYLYPAHLTQTSETGNGWVIMEHELLKEYVTDRRELVLSPRTAVVDGHTNISHGLGNDYIQYENLHAFFESPTTDSEHDEGGRFDAFVTISGGVVTGILIPYRP